MPWNGSGGFSRSDGTRTGATVWDQAKTAGVKVVAVDHDTHDEDLATGLENCLTLDGQNSPSADISWGNNKITNLEASTSLLGAANLQQVQAGSSTWGGTTGGSSTAYTITITPAPPALQAGMVFRFIPHIACGDSPTLQINALAAKNLTNQGGVAFSATDLKPGHIITAVYDGSDFRCTY